MNTIIKFKKLHSLRLAVLVLGMMGILLLPSCKKSSKDKIAAGPTFDLDLFETELKASIQPSGAIGWTYVISQNGLYARGGAFGKSRNNADGSRTMTINRKINIASVSKFLTAIAVMQLLERRNLTENSAIGPWLPGHWSKGPGVATLTFGDLLGHTSGLSSANSQFRKTLGYAGLQLTIDTGVIFPQGYLYRNANFALFRILIPSLWKGLSDAPNIGILDSATTENTYLQYMDEHVFSPIGLNNVTCEPEARSIATLYYAVGDGETTNGNPYDSWSSMSGGGGYYMTTFELATVMAYFEHTEILVSKEARTTMKANRFGMDRQSASYEQHGLYFGKNGSIINGGQGTIEQVVIFPNGIEVVVMFNTQGMIFAGGETSLSRAIFDAYNKSWK